MSQKSLNIFLSSVIKKNVWASPGIKIFLRRNRLQGALKPYYLNPKLCELKIIDYAISTPTTSSLTWPAAMALAMAVSPAQVSVAVGTICSWGRRKPVPEVTSSRSSSPKEYLIPALSQAQSTLDPAAMYITQEEGMVRNYND